jgi:type IV secretion system protein VirB5
MKKSIITASLLLFTSFTNLNGAGIPVIDSAALSQDITQNIKTIEEWAREAERWGETASHYTNQLKAYEDELLSKTGIRDSVQFMKDLNRLNNYAKSYGDDYLDLAKAFANPSTVIGNQSRKLFDKYNVFDRCENDIYKAWEKEACENKLKRDVTEIATIEESKNKTDEIFKNLDDLSKKLSNTEDIKESQDVQNAINVELAQLQIINMRLEMLDKQNQAQARIEDEQKLQKRKEKQKNGQGNYLK